MAYLPTTIVTAKSVIIATIVTAAVIAVISLSDILRPALLGRYRPLRRI